MTSSVGSDAYNSTMDYGYSSYDNRLCQEQEHWKESLFDALQSIRPQGQIATNCHQLFVNPGLSIKDHPIVPLPLTEYYTQAIKQLGSSNPSCKNVWELNHAQFNLTNPAWPSFFGKITFDIVKDFESCYVETGCPRLSLYGPGSFVEQEKGLLTKDAYGTLLICLPSEHRGADIILSSEGQSHHISTAHSSAQDLSVTGWTSSFDYQVSTLDSGYRLAISYDIHWTELISTPSSRQSQECDRVAKLLSEWPRYDRMFYKHLYALNDKSQGRPLSLAGMKGRDRAVCQTLNRFCIEAKLFMLFAEITHEVVYNRGVRRISSSIDRVYTADGLHLTTHASLNAKKELLGFHMDKLENHEADGGDVENSSLSEAQEEGKIIKRYHDTTVVLVHMNHLLRFVVLEEIGDYDRSKNH